MTIELIPSSRELVRITRENWNLTKAEFGARLGTSGEFAGRVEHGQQVFSDNFINPGCTHPDAELRAFWQAYRSARRHEQDVAIIENCLGTAAAS